MIKSFSSNENQSPYVIIETIKYILKEIYPKTEKKLDILYNFLEWAEEILNLVLVKEVINNFIIGKLR